MKLFKKFLSILLSFGIIFSSARLLCVFAEGDNKTSAISVSRIPETLEECCSALDKILTTEEKDNIKQSSLDLNSYLRKLSYEPLGKMIQFKWLSAYKDNTTALYTLLLEHGVGFDGSMELKSIMLNIILENYRHYLLTGENVKSIEELAIDYWFNYHRCFNPTIQRKYYEEMMKKWIITRESRKNQNKQSWCIIL